jgi:hypothetical protein
LPGLPAIVQAKRWFRDPHPALSLLRCACKARVFLSPWRRSMPLGRRSGRGVRQASIDYPACAADCLIHSQRVAWCGIPAILTRSLLAPQRVQGAVCFLLLGAVLCRRGEGQDEGSGRRALIIPLTRLTVSSTRKGFASVSAFLTFLLCAIILFIL